MEVGAGALTRAASLPSLLRGTFVHTTGPLEGCPGSLHDDLPSAELWGSAWSSEATPERFLGTPGERVSSAVRGHACDMPGSPITKEVITMTSDCMGGLHR